MDNINNFNSLTGEKLTQGQQYTNAQGNTVTQGTALTPQQLQPTSAMDFSKTIVEPQTNFAGIGAGATAVQKDFQKYLDLANQPSPEQNSLDALIAGLNTASEGLQGRGAAQLQADQQSGFNQGNKELADLNAQFMARNAEYNKSLAAQDAEQAKLEAEAGGRGLTTNMLLGQQGAIAKVRATQNRQEAADLTLLQAQVLGKQGQVQAARDAANRAVDLMFQDREAVYNTKLNQYNMAKDTLEKIDAKKTKALDYALQKEEQKIAEEKVLEKYKADTVITAQAAGAPQSLIEAAGKAKTSLEVAQILGKYSPETLKYELLKEQIKTEKAQRANYNASAAKTRKETDQIGAAVVGLDGLISTLPKSSQERYYKLQGDFDAATKNYRGAIDSANSITALSKDSTPQQQTAMIFQYMKTLDPSSTVREGEFALVGKTAGLSDRAVNALRKLDNGSRLNEAQIADIVGAAQVLSRNAKQNLDLTSAEYDRRAAKFGLPTGLFYEPQEVQQDVVDNKFSQGLGGSIQSFNTQGLSVTKSGDLDWQLPSNEPVKTNQFISGNKAKLK